MRAAKEWGVSLDTWYRIPPNARAMMIAYERVAARLAQAMMEDSRGSGPASSTIRFG